jgi:hypothetical protein
VPQIERMYVMLVYMRSMFHLTSPKKLAFVLLLHFLQAFTLSYKALSVLFSLYSDAVHKALLFCILQQAPLTIVTSFLLQVDTTPFF